MTLHPAIAALREAGPLNIVWGAGCSYAEPQALKNLLSNLRINQRLTVDAEGVHDALLSLSPAKRRERTSQYGINWAHLCLAELLRAGRVARLLTGNFDDGIVKAASLCRLLPALYDGPSPELSVSVNPCVYRLGEASAGAVGPLIARGAQTGAWLVIGCSGRHFGLADGLAAVPRFEHGLYWIGHFDQPPPKVLGRAYFDGSRGAHFVDGFDAASFLAALLGAVSQFPPEFVIDVAAPPAKPARPAVQLQRWRGQMSERIYRIRDSFPATAGELLQKAAVVRDPSYDSLVSQAIREYELYFRWSPENGHSASVFLELTASKRSPAEAARLFRQGLEWIRRFPGSTGMQAMDAHYTAQAWAGLARFRTGPQADSLFAKAEQALAGVADPGPLAAYLLDAWSELLCRWADQERGDPSAAIFERACEKFRAVERLEPQRRDRVLVHAEALRRRAAAVRGDVGRGLLVRARTLGEQLRAGNPRDAAACQFLAMTALVEASYDPGRLGESDRLFREAMTLRPEDAGDIVADWAAALGEAAMAATGPSALALYARASETFRQAEAAQPDSGAVRRNWSSTLIREARERGGVPELWERAAEQAHRADAIDPGSGAYNLACIAAERNDRAGVTRWLERSAAYGQIMPLSHLRRDINFSNTVSEPWFAALVHCLYDLACD